TPSVALRHYVDPTEAAFERALDWRPAEKGGARSGAPSAQNAAQQGAAPNRGELQAITQALQEEVIPPNPATPSDIVHVRPRECMGIEPTESFVQTPRWF